MLSRRSGGWSGKEEGSSAVRPEDQGETLGKHQILPGSRHSGLAVRGIKCRTFLNNPCRLRTYVLIAPLAGVWPTQDRQGSYPFTVTRLPADRTLWARLSTPGGRAQVIDRARRAWEYGFRTLARFGRV